MTPDPMLPLPPPLRGGDPNAPFPLRTLSSRLPGIARQVAESVPWHSQARARLFALADEMPHGKMRPLDDPLAPDAAAWERDLIPYLGQTWLEIPWLVAEMVFFRRLLEATGYYQVGPGMGVDPYTSQKLQERQVVVDALQRWHAVVQDAASPTSVLPRLLHINIWGNQADRSMWPRGSEIPGHPPDGNLAENLLVDHAAVASAFLLAVGRHAGRVDILLDNVGVELAYDLGLADFLLQHALASRIVLHVKPHPTYVSDATRQDVLEMLAFLFSVDEVMAPRLQDYLADNRLALQSDYFWTSLHSAWQMPEALYSDLSQADLLIIKGDANYRRWLGDRHWPYTTPAAEILSFRPAPLLLLRVLKANIIAGLRPGQAEQTARQDEIWLYSGKWGIVQFVP